MYNFDSYNVLLSIATNIPVLLMTAFVLQGHKCSSSASYMSASCKQLVDMHIISLLINRVE